MKYTKVRDVKSPQRDISENVGWDLFIPNDWNEGKPFKLYVGEQVNIPSGIKLALEKDTAMIIENKSGVALKRGISRGACVIDFGYTGEIHLNLHKGVKGTEDQADEKGYYTVLNPGDKIIQGIIYQVDASEAVEMSNEEYDNLPKTKRGAGGFGSTGTK